MWLGIVVVGVSCGDRRLRSSGRDAPKYHGFGVWTFPPNDAKRQSDEDVLFESRIGNCAETPLVERRSQRSVSNNKDAGSWELTSGIDVAPAAVRLVA